MTGLYDNINKNDKIIECVPVTFLIDRDKRYLKNQNKINITEIKINPLK